MPNERILIVEDESAISDLIRYNLEKEGYTQLRVCSDGERALDQVKQFHPDLILLDLMLPGINGLDVCRKIKGNSDLEKISIVMLTAKSEESDVVVGLELGADDYITKPFSSKLLIARIRAALRRSAIVAKPDSKVTKITFGPIQMDLLSHEVLLDGEPIQLTVGEYNILKLFASQSGHVFTREKIVYQTRGDDYPVTERAIDVQILGLRRKLGAHAGLIETIRGVGYRISEEKE